MLSALRCYSETEANSWRIAFDLGLGREVSFYIQKGEVKES